MKIRCNRCEKIVDGIITPQIAKFTHELQATDKRIPKYNVMLRATCSECDRYITFVSQTSDTVDEANENMTNYLNDLANHNSVIYNKGEGNPSL